ncbi:MAG: PEP-CTERM sorting domain-containing protein [Verrucomicrobia bacterium]|nr:PEP-CTERM sorting domain-containing protein [Verrucomicrobiota bacterium]
MSDGHIDIFEVHYDSSVVPTEFALHIHDHVTETHFEAADVILQVNESSYFASPSGLVGVLGASSYILPASQEAGMLYGGISADGPLGVFQNNRFRIQMVSAGSENPGNFALYRFSGGGTLQVGLQSLGGSVSVNEVTVPIGGHEHWNWGFSAPGIYTFEFKGLGTKSVDLSILETAPEIFTFHVIPEPSSGALVLAGTAVVLALRRMRR